MNVCGGHGHPRPAPSITYLLLSCCLSRHIRDGRAGSSSGNSANSILHSMLSDEELSMLLLYSSEEGLTESKFGMEMKPGLIQIVSMLKFHS